MPLQRPTFIIDGLRLTRNEFHLLGTERVSFWNTMARRIQALDDYYKDALATATKENDAGRTGVAIKIRDGAIERISIGISDLEAGVAGIPSVADVRKNTLARMYNYDADVLRGTVENNNTILKANAPVPNWLFDEIDSNADGALTTTEIRAYWDAL